MYRIKVSCVNCLLYLCKQKHESVAEAGQFTQNISYFYYEHNIIRSKYPKNVVHRFENKFFAPDVKKTLHLSWEAVGLQLRGMSIALGQKGWLSSRSEPTYEARDSHGHRAR